MKGYIYVMHLKMRIQSNSVKEMRVTVGDCLINTAVKISMTIRRKGIEDAIDELEESSSAGPDGIPAIFLKKTKEVISLPLAIILRKSLDNGEMTDTFKMAYITPIHKGGERKNSERYRPASLTSYIMNIFERVLKKSIIEHLVENQAINRGQHGFALGRST